MMLKGLTTAAILTLAIFVATSSCEKNKDTKLKKKRDKFAETHLSLKGLLSARGLCESTEFQCTYDNTCISLDQVCDTHRDCLGGGDEVGCPTDCTGQNQFKCENSNKCIGVIDKCDGSAECSDYSDEAFCATVECAAGRFKCADSKECIEADYVCDRQADCEDGSDERNCHNGTCSSAQWQCADNDRCIPHSYLCDGDFDCTDRSDETSCTCASYQFRCANSHCIPSTYKCDGDNDCGDKSDEIDCPGLPSYICGDQLTFADCFHMNETTHPICLVHADADKFCRKFCGLCT
ncbi:hypothetical protein BsWGS_05822 [Bradybaena similaris]